MSILPSINLFVCLSCLSILFHMSVILCLSVHQPDHLSAFLSICLSVHLPVCLSILPSVSMSFHPSICLSACLTVSLRPSVICLPFYLSASLFVSLSLSLSLQSFIFFLSLLCFPADYPTSSK